VNVTHVYFFVCGHLVGLKLLLPPSSGSLLRFADVVGAGVVVVVVAVVVVVDGVS